MWRWACPAECKERARILFCGQMRRAYTYGQARTRSITGPLLSPRFIAGTSQSQGDMTSLSQSQLPSKSPLWISRCLLDEMM